MIRKYVKKPVIIEAVQWTGLNLNEVKEFVGDSLEYEIHDAAWKAGAGKPRVFMKIKTLEGDHIAIEGDYIIKGIKGEFYPCKPDIFEETYNLVLDETNTDIDKVLEIFSEVEDDNKSGDDISYWTDPMEFIKSYSFKDKEEIYTNGSDLVPVFRVEQMLEMYTENLLVDLRDFFTGEYNHMDDIKSKIKKVEDVVNNARIKSEFITG